MRYKPNREPLFVSSKPILTVASAECFDVQLELDCRRNSWYRCALLWSVSTHSNDDQSVYVFITCHRALFAARLAQLPISTRRSCRTSYRPTSYECTVLCACPFVKILLPFSKSITEKCIRSPLGYPPLSHNNLSSWLSGAHCCPQFSNDYLSSRLPAANSDKHLRSVWYGAPLMLPVWQHLHCAQMIESQCADSHTPCHAHE